MLSPVSLALLALLAPIQEPVPGIVRGQVRSESTAAPVAGARVELVGVSGAAAVADSAGYYVLRGVPPGRQLVRASHIDHDALQVEVHVPAGGEFLLDFVLELRPVTLPRVTADVIAVRGARDTVAAAAPELSAASMRALEATPGVAELGIAEAARRFPSDEPIDPSEILYVRGAVADLKLVLLDGAPVYAPFHLAGLIAPFETGVLRGANLYLGGAPSRYDGGLSYVLDLETRAARRSRQQFLGGVDFLSARGMAEGPITGRAGYLVEARALHGLGTEHLLNESFPYGYADGLMRVDVDVGADGVVSVTGFWNEESVDLDTARSGMEPARWGNAAGSVRYRGVVLGADAELTASYGAFGATMPLGDRREVVARGDLRRTHLNADFGTDAGPARMQFGVTYDRLDIHQRLGPREGSSGSPTALAERAEGTVTGAYVDASIRPQQGVVLRGGVRADVFSLSPAVRLAPRLAASWMVTDRLVVKLSAGRFRQYVSVPEPLGSSGGPLVPGSGAVRRPLAIARASHVVLGIDHEVGQGVRAGFETFIKRFEGMPSAVAPSLPTEPKPDDVESNASGMDLWLRRSSGRLQGWLGYSVAWVWSEGGGYALTRAASGRQLVSAGLSGPIGPDGQFEVRFSYGAGLPYTAVPDVGTTEPALAATTFPVALMRIRSEGPGGGSGRPDEPYLRIDAEVSHTWYTRLRDATLEVTPYIRVLNALDRRDALFYRFDGDGSLQPLGVLPVLPVLGVEWRF